MTTDKTLEQLKQCRERHFELGSAVMQADGGAIYPFDLLVLATLNRSLCLLKGFVSLIEDRNFVAAARSSDFNLTTAFVFRQAHS